LGLARWWYSRAGGTRALPRGHRRWVWAAPTASAGRTSTHRGRAGSVARSGEREESNPLADPTAAPRGLVRQQGTSVDGAAMFHVKRRRRPERAVHPRRRGPPETQDVRHVSHVLRSVPGLGGSGARCAAAPFAMHRSSRNRRRLGLMRWWTRPSVVVTSREPGDLRRALLSAATNTRCKELIHGRVPYRVCAVRVAGQWGHGRVRRM
jgi:hypothetical protein